MASINITMKNKSKMYVEYDWNHEELICYWPGKKRGREIPFNLYDYEDALVLAEEDYKDNQEEEYCNYLLERY